jgi:hypothetical protein
MYQSATCPDRVCGSLLLYETKCKKARCFRCGQERAVQDMKDKKNIDRNLPVPKSAWRSLMALRKKAFLRDEETVSDYFYLSFGNFY